MRGSLNWGPFSWLNGVALTYGWWNTRRQTYASGFHTYSVEWTPKFIRVYVDTRLHYMLDLSFNEPFFDRGKFPATVLNDSQYIVTPNPWVNGTADGDWTSAAIMSDGSYGVPEGIISSFPCTSSGGRWEVVQGLEVDEFSRGKIDASVAELVEERDAVRELGLI